MLPATLPIVHVWYAYQNRNAKLLPALKAARLLDREEMSRYERYHFQEDKDLYLLSHAMLRVMLSQWAPVDPRDWQFSRSEHGKPAISHPVEYQSLQFNISHTRGLAACAICTPFTVGIDVEYSKRQLSLLPVARRFFASDEIKYLEAASDEELRYAFFEIWTLKEAYLKACGIGLFAESLQDFAMVVEDRDSAKIRFKNSISDSGRSWQFYRYRPDPDYLLALAVRRPGYEDLHPLVSEADLQPALS
jgi:4'-phosphopantetheinyl transferase